jgi:hypothetical protein
MLPFLKLDKIATFTALGVVVGVIENRARVESGE